MTGYELPISVDIGSALYPIRSDFRVILGVLCGLADPDLDGEGKGLLILKCLYPGWEKIPIDRIPEALEKASEFIDCGQKDDGKRKPSVIDWEQDAALIVPAVNCVAHTEVRGLPYLHWWSFFGYFMEVRESLFSSVLHLRNKKAKGQKMEKWEQDFYKENRAIIDLRPRMSEEEKELLDNFKKWLDS